MKASILQMLKTTQRQWLAGPDICRRLNISRTAVWKHIQNLKQDGYQIQTEPRRGYQLIASPDCLYPWEIASSLKTEFIGQRIIHHQQLSSTNDEAKRLARDKTPAGTVIVAEQQTGGRGRMGRRWYGAGGKDIALSVVLYPTILPAEAARFSMLAAVAVARAIKQTCNLPVEIKWPNDLLIAGRKLCGILVEMSAEMDGVKYLVLGIGINVNATAALWPQEIKNKTTSLYQQVGTEVSRVDLTQNLLYQLERLYLQWQNEGFAPIMGAWRADCVSQQCFGRITTAQGQYTGWIEGIDDSGALLLRLPEGTIHTFMSGDVSLRTIN